MRNFTKSVLALAMLFVAVGASAKTEKVHATFENPSNTNTTWTADATGATKGTFTWSTTYYNQLRNIGLPSGDITKYKKLVVDCKINSGEKKEEYRTISPNWAKRFLWFEYLEGEDLALLCHYLTGPFSEFPIDLNYINTGMSGRRVDSNGIPINDINSYFRFGLQIAKYQYVVFHRGYTKETMKFDLDSISIGKGNPKLGAPEGKNVFILKLGKRHELV